MDYRCSITKLLAFRGTVFRVRPTGNRLTQLRWALRHKRPYYKRFLLRCPISTRAHETLKSHTHAPSQTKSYVHYFYSLLIIILWLCTLIYTHIQGTIAHLSQCLRLIFTLSMLCRSNASRSNTLNHITYTTCVMRKLTYSNTLSTELCAHYVCGVKVYWCVSKCVCVGLYYGKWSNSARIEEGSRAGWTKKWVNSTYPFALWFLYFTGRHKTATSLSVRSTEHTAWVIWSFPSTKNYIFSSTTLREYREYHLAWLLRTWLAALSARLKEAKYHAARARDPVLFSLTKNHCESLIYT